MNRTLRTLLASTAMAVALPALGFAASTLPTPISVNGGSITEAQIADGLHELGYTDITYLKGEGRYYTVRAHYDGHYVPIQVDSETGDVSRLGDPDTQVISLVGGTSDADVATELRQLGYGNVMVGATQGRYLDATAARYGQDVNLTVDMETGLVNNIEQDETWYVEMRDDLTDADVSTQLGAMGFTEVHQLTQTDNAWNGYAVRDGQKMQVWVDDQSGEVRAWPADNQG